MDNNNPTTTTPTPEPGTVPPTVGSTPAAQPANPTQPGGPAPSVTTNVNVSQPGGGATPPAGGGNKMMFVFVGLLVLVLAFGGVYYFMSRPKETPAPQPQTTTAVPQDTIEEDLDEITVEDLDSDFTSIDADLQSL